MNSHIAKLFQPSGSGMTLVFSATAVRKFLGELRYRGRYVHGGGKILQFLTEIAV